MKWKTTDFKNKKCFKEKKIHDRLKKKRNAEYIFQIKYNKIFFNSFSSYDSRDHKLKEKKNQTKLNLIILIKKKKS